MKKLLEKDVGLATSKLKALAMGGDPSIEETKDLVNHPSHYNKGIETNEYIKSWDMSYAQGNVIKYVSRYNLKNTDPKLQLQDLEKAQWYLNDLVKDLKNDS